jgi:hypothetical protein
VGLGISCIRLSSELGPDINSDIAVGQFNIKDEVNPPSWENRHICVLPIDARSSHLGVLGVSFLPKNVLDQYPQAREMGYFQV